MLLDAYYEGYRVVARKRRLPLIDHHARWCALRDEDRARFQAYVPDGVHPEAAGGAAITFPGVLAALPDPDECIRLK